ncbi:hypothetical protein CMV30_12495 [Nibricoccus aquaticus]|uniref:Uncharacterized protein n=1 Tax=Nibricoccus aquaticus TaxID=2576891 RepID=A0A290QL74_9BACT|nr:hypothetical protein CMV30_12495 [Nibricoccus aquaticus]
MFNGKTSRPSFVFRKMENAPARHSPAIHTRITGSETCTALLKNCAAPLLGSPPQVPHAANPAASPRNTGTPPARKKSPAPASLATTGKLPRNVGGSMLATRASIFIPSISPASASEIRSARASPGASLPCQAFTHAAVRSRSTRSLSRSGSIWINTCTAASAHTVTHAARKRLALDALATWPSRHAALINATALIAPQSATPPRLPPSAIHKGNTSDHTARELSQLVSSSPSPRRISQNIHPIAGTLRISHTHAAPDVPPYTRARPSLQPAIENKYPERTANTTLTRLNPAFTLNTHTSLRLRACAPHNLAPLTIINATATPPPSTEPNTFNPPATAPSQICTGVACVEKWQRSCITENKSTQAHFPAASDTKNSPAVGWSNAANATAINAAKCHNRLTDPSKPLSNHPNPTANTTALALASTRASQCPFSPHQNAFHPVATASRPTLSSNASCASGR